MKYFYIISTLAFIQHISAQNETINFEFSEVKPIWTHTIVDSTFEEIIGQDYWTKYSSLTVGNLYRNDDYLLILSNSKEAGALLDDYGFILDKIDIETGELAWKHHNTMYVGGNQDFYHNINIREDGNIELVGVERHGPNQGLLNWSLGAFNSNSIRKIIDINDGELIETYHAQDSIYEIYLQCRHNRLFPLVEDSLYINAIMIGGYEGEVSDPQYYYGTIFQLMDREMEKIIETDQRFDFDTLGPFSIDQPSFLNRLNENTIVSIAFKDRYDSWENKGLKIMWNDISDPYNITTTRIIDYKDIVSNSKESFLNLRFKTLNNTIFLGHRYPNFDIQDNCAYILWLDAYGEIKSFVDLPYYGEHLYQITDMIYANNDYAYLLAYPSSTGRLGFDLIKIEDGVDTIEFVSSITAKNEGEEFGTQVNAVYEDGYVIFGGLVKREGQGTKTSNKYFCFRAEDLGLAFDPVSTIQLDLNEKKYRVYPNPTTGTFIIKEDIENEEIRLFDISGKSIKIDKSNSNTYDISELPSGTYFLQIKTDKIIENHKIVKVE